MANFPKSPIECVFVLQYVVWNHISGLDIEIHYGVLILEHY